MIKVHDIDVNYIQYGSGRDVVLLHGWGQNIEMMTPLADPISEHFRVTILDLPGFGKSSEPKTVWTVKDYVLFLKDFLETVQVENPILIGHSFGGRLAILYASLYETRQVVLFGAPCIRKKEGPTLKEKMLKTAKKLPLMASVAETMKKHIGSTDYKNASPMMREILVKTVNQDLSESAKKIKAPTLLIWGENDEAVPLSDAQALEQLLQDGALIVLPGSHYAYLENLGRVLAILKEFMEG